MRRRSRRRAGASPRHSGPTTTPSSSAATRSTRTSAPTAIRCGFCPTAISASRADPSSRPRRWRSLAVASAGHRRAERQGRDVPAPGAAVGPLPLALCQRRSRRATFNNGALPPDLSVMAKARPGGPDYHLRAADRLSAGAGRLRAGAGHALQRGLPRASDRHAAAFDATASSPIPTAPSRRSTIMRATSPPI